MPLVLYALRARHVRYRMLWNIAKRQAARFAVLNQVPHRFNLQQSSIIQKRQSHGIAQEYLPSHQPDFTESQKTVREAISKICVKFPDEYWFNVDETKKWPSEFTDAIAKDGWLGICMPPEYGGSELGIAEV